MGYTVKVAFDDGTIKEKVVRGKKRDKEGIQSIVKEFEDKYTKKELVSMEVVDG